MSVKAILALTAWSGLTVNSSRLAAHWVPNPMGPGNPRFLVAPGGLLASKYEGGVYL